MTMREIAGMSWWRSQKLLRQKLAWQWWQQQQTRQLHHSADSIRNSLLQQTFAFRRYLENGIQSKQPVESSQQSASKKTQAEHPPADAIQFSSAQQWLSQLQTFYHSLENLSNELSPPFLFDDLPLAVNFAVQNRKCAVPTLKTNIALPTYWPSDPSQPISPCNNPIVLSVLSELLTLLLGNRATAQQLNISLSHEAELCRLTVEIEDNDAAALQQAIAQLEIQHLKEIFHSLAAGQLEIKGDGTWLVGYLHWPNT